MWQDVTPEHEAGFVSYQQWLKAADLRKVWPRADLWDLWVSGQNFPSLGRDAAIVLAIPGHTCDMERSISAVNNISDKCGSAMSRFTLTGRLRSKFNGSFDVKKGGAVAFDGE